MYGHGSNLEEIFLELARNSFKGCLETNTNKDEHISAMERGLGRDWISRVNLLLCCLKTGDENEKREVELGLRFLLLGHHALTVPQHNTAVSALFYEFPTQIIQMICETLTGVLTNFSQLSIPWATSMVWEAVNYSTARLTRSAFLAEGLRKLREYYPAWIFKTVNGVRLVARDKFTGLKRTYPHNRVSVRAPIVVHTNAIQVERGLTVAGSGDDLADSFLGSLVLFMKCKMERTGSIHARCGLFVRSWFVKITDLWSHLRPLFLSTWAQPFE